MHEYSIAQALVASVERQARAHGARAVAAVAVRLGALSGVEPQLLAPAYEHCAAGTLCEGAPLQITAVEAHWICGRCAQGLEPDGVLRCPACGGAAVLAAGDEITLERLDLRLG